jgi:hypothetical protein
MNRSVLNNIESVAAAGKAVMVGDSKTIEAIVKDAIENERTVSFYLTNAQADAVREWYWKPSWVAYTGLREISAEEATNISSKLGLDNLKGFRFAAVQCACGHTYGAFEFLEQGIREHGLESVKAVFALKNAKFLQVNPSLVPVCPACGQKLKRDPGGITYEGPTYAGCSCCAPERAKVLKGGE